MCRGSCATPPTPTPVPDVCSITSHAEKHGSDSCCGAAPRARSEARAPLPPATHRQARRGARPASAAAPVQARPLLQHHIPTPHTPIHARPGPFTSTQLRPASQTLPHYRPSSPPPCRPTQSQPASQPNPGPAPYRFPNEAPAHTASRHPHARSLPTPHEDTRQPRRGTCPVPACPEPGRGVSSEGGGGSGRRTRHAGDELRRPPSPPLT
uniref:uncharacterized protein LOC130476115 n=1 Tax=Euleptes europaea TaxID=460621 RepID=UPI00253FB006|nr:uncharacterized protein LOC130476115 [Euleptes europaea]